MSGRKVYSMREGDRSEYFAQVLLSGLGLSIPIPRQEDIGFDFSCNIADQESGMLSFGHPYLISVKSASKPNIELNPTDRAKRQGDQVHISWLFRQELPLFLGVVEKGLFQMRIYSLIPLWFIYYENGPRCGALKIVPRTDPEDLRDVGRPVDKGKIPGWPRMHSFEVDLGHPIAVLDLDTLKDPEKTNAIKDRMRFAAKFAQLNHMHSRLGIPHFYWFAKTRPDGSQCQPAFFYLPVPSTSSARESIMRELAPSLISFGLHFKEANDAESLNAVRKLLEPVPEDFFPDPVREHLPEVITKKGDKRMEGEG